ncbi:MAG: RNA-dependent DNA polymerase [Chloroflexaceae bacterium]|nr:RNA-dependent DNA polymerase [Chloroflexaceae bacterium]
MPKTYRHLYEALCDVGTLYHAYRRARRGKRRRPDVAAFEFRFEEQLVELAEALASERYRPGRYRSFRVFEHGKQRIISAAPFRDRVVHHAVCAQIEPIWEARFIHDSYASRAGKGTHAALDRAQHFARGHRYALQLDMQQFFPSVDHALLLGMLARHIADERLLRLIERILAGGAHLSRTSYTMVYFAGDDLFAAARPRGLPIGNQTSQFWANVYLHPLDLFIKQELHCRAYVRYCDDLLLFAHDKATLHRWRAAVSEQAARLRLTLHERRAQVVPVETGLPFLGWRLFPYRRRLKRRNVVAFARRWRHQRARYARGECTLADLQARLLGWLGHARQGQTRGLRRSLLAAPLPRVGQP